MNSVCEDIKDILLADSDLGLQFGVNLFIAREPAKPSTFPCISLYDVPGYDPQLTFTKGENYFRDSFQVRVKSDDYTTGYAKACDIMISLHGRGPETWNGTLYTVIACSLSPALLGWDDNNRVIFITNFNVQRR